MPAAGVVMIIGVLLIVVALVYYLVATIVALQKITKGLDDAIGGVGEIIQKTEPVNGVVETINANLDAGVDLLEGLLVKKAGMADAVGLVDGLYPGAAADGFRNFPESTKVEAPPAPLGKATEAASDGVLSPFTTPATISSFRASAQSYAGYDGAASSARARAAVEGRLTTFLALRVEFDHGPATGARVMLAFGSMPSSAVT